MNHITSVITSSLELFARGGGGGSGGSSGGGGEGILFILGYLPMHFVGALLRKAFLKNEALTIPLNIVGWIIAAVYAVLWTTWWPGLGVLIAIAALVGMPAGLYSWFGKLKQSKFVKSSLQKAASNDSAWDEQKLTEFVKQAFVRYQHDWSNFRVESIKKYTTPEYFAHTSLLLAVLKAMGRRNSMEDVVVTDAMVTDMVDAEDNAYDTFTMGITAKAKDMLVEVQSGDTLFTDNSEFTEYWTFRRSGDTWLLAGIGQVTASGITANPGLAAFAAQQGYFYSQDMGWLFIPKRGQLFNGSKFGVSDINNHVVGLYKNELLVQLYSYVKNPQQNTKAYVIAQVNVPRQYGNIIVRRNKLIQAPVFGMERVQTEWTQFNKKYEVFASSAEQATSFELLNPTYMEQLEALPFEVNIEVVDNVVYLHTNEKSADVTTYETMLDIIHKAFKEMRL